MLLTSFLLMVAGFAALALGIDRHHRDLLGRAPTEPRRTALRLAGAVLIALSLAGCIAARGIEMGLVWFGALAGLAPVPIVLGLSIYPLLRRR